MLVDLILVRQSVLNPQQLENDCHRVVSYGKPVLDSLLPRPDVLELSKELFKFRCHAEVLPLQPLQLLPQFRFQKLNLLKPLINLAP